MNPLISQTVDRALPFTPGGNDSGKAQHFQVLGYIRHLRLTDDFGDIVYTELPPSQGANDTKPTFIGD